VFTSTLQGLVYPRSDAGDTHEGLMMLELIGMMVGKVGRCRCGLTL